MAPERYASGMRARLSFAAAALLASCLAPSVVGCGLFGGDDDADGRDPVSAGPRGGGGSAGDGGAAGGGDGAAPAPPPTPGERFELAATPFALPQGGIALSGFAGPARQDGFENVGDELWVLEDMNGDGIPDLVITTVVRDVLGEEDVDDTFDEPYGYPTRTPHWRVHLGGPNGFAPAFTTWSLPTSGGRIGRGYHRAQNQQSAGDRIRNDRGLVNKQGDEAWILRDLDGDGRPDLVVTGAAREIVQVGYVFEVFGLSGTPSWKVYRNTGAGFEATATTWPVPKAGWDDGSGLSLASSATVAFYRKRLWELRDVDGDGKPDLLAYAVVENPSTNVYRARPPGQSDGAPRWEVYLNDGRGFATTPTSFALPRQRGRGADGLAGTSGRGTRDGENLWAFFDVDGDRRPDLVVTATQIDGTPKAQGYPSESHWEVYRNTGTGFDPSLAKWALPRGGTGAGGFYVTGQAGSPVPGDDAWTTVDLDGDGKLDLLVTGEYVAGNPPGTYNLGRLANEPHWMLHRNTGAGFSEVGARWALPSPGGFREAGFSGAAGVGSRAGDEVWGLVDLTGDKQPELVRFATTLEDPRSPGFPNLTIPRVEGHGSAPRWLVHRNVP